MEIARTLNPRGWLLGGARGRAALWVAWQRASPGVVSFTVVLVDGIAGGGYFPRAWRLTSIALLAFALAALVARPRIALGHIERWFLGLVAALTAWTAASTIWSDTSGTSILEGERDVVYLAAAAALLLGLERESLPVLLGGTLGGITAVAGYGLGTYVLFDHPLNPIEGKLLFEPLGYANGLGIYAAIGILLAVGLALALRPLLAPLPARGLVRARRPQPLPRDPRRARPGGPRPAPRRARPPPPRPTQAARPAARDRRRRLRRLPRPHGSRLGLGASSGHACRPPVRLLAPRRHQGRRGPRASSVGTARADRARDRPCRPRARPPRNRTETAV